MSETLLYRTENGDSFASIDPTNLCIRVSVGWTKDIASYLQYSTVQWWFIEWSGGCYTGVHKCLPPRLNEHDIKRTDFNIPGLTLLDTYKLTCDGPTGKEQAKEHALRTEVDKTLCISPK